MTGIVYIILAILIGLSVGYVSAKDALFLEFYLFGWASMFVIIGLMTYFRTLIGS